MERQTACQSERSTSPTAMDLAKLEESFRTFTRVTSDLEAAYSKLTRRAHRIDLELRRTNRELARKVEELETVTRNKSGILDALPNGVAVVGPDGLVTCVNRAAERILGRPASEIIGRSRDAVVGPTGDRLLASEDECSGAHHTTAEREVVALDSSRRRISIVTTDLEDGSKLLILSDLTVVARLREQVNRLDTMAALGEMAAGVAHEIRNPLNGIDGFAALLGRQFDGERGDDVARYIDNIRRGVKEVDTIIDNLLSFATPGRVRTTPVDIAKIARDVVDGAMAWGGFHLADGRPRIRLTVDRGVDDIAMTGDAVKLKIVLTNLVKNACEASDAESPVDVKVENDAENRSVRLVVEDEAGGLDPTVRDRLFRPFTTTKANGTGLGLAIAHRFCVLHGGTIECDSTPRGTRFCVTLPATPREVSA